MLRTYGLGQCRHGGRRKRQTVFGGSEGLADEEVDASALAGVGDVKARVDVLLGEDEEAEAGSRRWAGTAAGRRCSSP